MTKSIATLKDKHPGEILYCIGSGPSLRFLEPEIFGDSPLLTINMAIVTVERFTLSSPVYSLQKDTFFIQPQHAPIIAHLHDWQPPYVVEPEYIFDCTHDFAVLPNVPSVVVAVYLSKWFGCREVVYLACDAATHEDVMSYDGENVFISQYPFNYLEHKPLVMLHSRTIKMPVSWQRIEEDAPSRI